MNYIYDVVLNFTDYNNYLEFYEWDKDDKFTYIDKIPIYLVNTLQMKEIINHKIKVSNSFLKMINNATTSSNGNINYSILVTDMEKVIALMFNGNGELIKKSSLLFDEEDAVISEIDYDMELFEYSLIEEISNFSFLTRHEKRIKKYLLDEVNYLYRNREYDEINYLYYEIFSEDKSIDEKYNSLINEIDCNNAFVLYDIIKLTE